MKKREALSITHSHTLINRMWYSKSKLMKCLKNLKEPAYEWDF